MPILSITVDKLKLPNPFFWHRGRERSRGQSGTIEIGPAERGKLDAPASRNGFACEHPGGIREGFQPGIEIGVELARNSVQRQEGFAQEEKVKRHWMALQSQLLHDLEGGVQWIANSLRQRNPDGLPIALEQPRQDFWRWLVAGDAVKTECLERVGSGAESQPAWLQSGSTSVRGAFLCFCTIRCILYIWRRTSCKNCNKKKKQP